MLKAQRETFTTQANFRDIIKDQVMQVLYSVKVHSFQNLNYRLM